MADFKARYERLREHLAGAAHVNAAKNLLEWDMETIMPETAADARASAVAHLAGIAHAKLTSPAYRDVLQPLAELRAAGAFEPSDPAYAVIGLAWQDFQRASRLPETFVSELEGLCAASHHVWKKARDKADWGAFLPNLTRIIAMKKEEARLVGYAKSPYDALLEQYEPGMDAERTAALLDGLAHSLANVVSRIRTSGVHDRGPLAIEAQQFLQDMLGRSVVKSLGFDLAGGRIDPTAHPFMTRIHPGDVRLTTRFDEGDALSSLFSTIHEAGHGMFEQGLPAELYGTPAGEVRSFALHESQSRLWENMVGRSRPFCTWLCGQMRHAVPIANVPSPDAVHRGLNRVVPSFIRTEADEVTYNLHICLRFRIERDLIEGRLDAGDVPEKWNALMNEYLGIVPANAADGALQDVHWSAGLFGYFPSYALGNVYAAQLYEAARRDIPKLEEGFAQGEFADLLAWLRENVHRHASLLDAETVVARASGKPPSADPFTAYVIRKYGDIYGF
jgi:carboxypeptidase Taq